MTAYLSAGGIQLSTVDLYVPWYGAPVAEILTSEAVTFSGSVVLTVGNLTLAMSVACNPNGVPLTGAFAGQTYARLVGGAGGWRVPVNLPPLANPVGVLLSTALADVAMAAVNPVSGVAETVALAAGLDRAIGKLWVPQTGAPAGRVMATLAGSLWWIDTAGVTQVATTRTGPTITPTAAQVEIVDRSMGTATIATEDVASWATPGATYQSATVPEGLTVNAAHVHSGTDGILRVMVMLS